MHLKSGLDLFILCNQVLNFNRSSPSYDSHHYALRSRFAEIVLFKEYLFLPFNLLAQFLLARQACHIFGRKELLVSIQDRILRQIFACFRTKQQPYGWIVPLRARKIIVHAHIHIHLPNVTVRKFGCFQINQERLCHKEVCEGILMRIL